MKNLNSDIKVAIWMVTYNHENYIQQAVESVMMQQINFDFHLFIGEDCSTDDTKSVCQKLKSIYPDKITLVLNDHNLGSYINALNIYKLCYESKADYMAMIEGDDYWIDPFKLQKQVDFLDKNPDYEVCFTNIQVVDTSGEIKKTSLITDNRKLDYEKKDLPIWSPTLTRVFRNRDFSKLPSAPGMDTLILLWQAQFGKIKFINEVTGSYRLHDGGIYSAQSDAKRKEQIFTTRLISLSIIESSLYSKYYGILFKKLVELYYLDEAVFNKNKTLLKQSFKTYSSKISLLLKIKIRLAFILISLPFNCKNRKTQSFLLNILNRVFIYSSK